MEKSEDLGIKIGSKREAFFTQAKKNTESEIESAKYAIEINEELVKVLDAKIAAEQSK